MLTFAAKLLDLMVIMLYNIYNGESFFKKIKNIFNFFVAFVGQSQQNMLHWSTEIFFCANKNTPKGAFKKGKGRR